MGVRILCSFVCFVGLLSNLFAQVPNDNPCNAIALAVNTNCNFATFSNAGANASVGVPAPGCANYLGGDVWFNVTVPASGSLSFDSNTGVITDGGMAIYSGACNALTLIECDDDDSPNGLMSFISRTGLTPGATIWIRMWEYGNNNNGTFGLCVYDQSTPPPPPPCTTPACSAPIPDVCNTACALGTLSTPPPCPATTVVNNNFCLTNIGANAESPYIYLSDCQGIIGNDMSAPAADTWYSFTATSSAATFTVSGLITPNIALYQGTNCNNSFGLGCNIGAAGSVSFTYNSLTVGQSYLVRISGGNSTDTGNFNLGISSFNNCDDCLINSSLVVNPTPFNGLYLAGQTVEFCYTVEVWDQTGVNWLHSVVPFLGPGWDLNSLAPSVTPPSCDMNGDWDWYNSVTSDNTGLIFGPGFFYDSNLGDFPADYPDSNPGDNFGDNCAGPWTFCWVATVGDCPPNTNGENLNVSIETFGDSESGSWTTLGCLTDPVYEFFSTASCCPEPQLNNSNPLCVGGNDGEIYAETTGLPPFIFTYESPLGNIIQSNTQNQTIDTLIGLSAGWYFVTIQDDAGCTGVDSIELIDPAVLNGTFDTTICQNLSFNYNGTNYSELNTTGVEVLTSIGGCDSLVTVTVTISPLPSIVVDRGDTSICANQVPIDILTTVSDATGILWDDPASSTISDISVSPNTTTSYIITATNTCGSVNRNISITLFDTTNQTIDTTVCEMFTFNGTDYFSSTTISDTFISPHGCDSILNYNFNVIYPVFTIENLDSCNSVTYQGNTYSQDTTVRDTIPGNLGVACPTLFISEMLEGSGLNKCIEIFNGTGSSVNLATYSLQFYFNGSASVGTTINLSGTLLDGNTYVVCDDGANASLLGAANQTSNANFYNGNDAIALYDGSGLVDLIGNIGCDPGTEWTGVGNGTQDNSMIRLPSYVAGVTFDPINIPCNFPSFIPSNWESTNSISSFSSLGSHLAFCNTSASFTPYCDSIFETNITIIQSDSTFANASSCNPANVGVASVTNPNQFTCDSVHTITTTLLPSDSTFANATSCNPANVGVASVTNPNQFTCDSVHTITTTLLATSFATENITACDSVFVLGAWLLNSSSFNDTLIGGAANGCDSVVTYNISINQSSQTSESIVACDSALIQGTGYFSSQNIVFNNLNAQACDSTHTVFLTINNSDVVTDNITACDSYTWIDGITYTSGNNTASFSLVNAASCDSIVNLNLTILPSSAQVIDLSFCPYELPITLASGLVIDGSQSSYTDVLINSNNCDSLITYNVFVSTDFSVSPNYIVALSGDSVEFIINNENSDAYFSYISSNGDNCDAFCQSYFVYPDVTVNYYFFTIIDSTNGCTFKDTLRVDLEYYSQFNVPNIFTPNGDGQNDIYLCYGEDIVEFQLEIFDRWGGRMFISNDLNYGWDGLFNNFAVESGIYIAVIRAAGQDGQKYELTQKIKLVR